MSESRLFVGNLAYQTIDTDLQDLFSQAGVVSSVNVMMDKFTGKSRGFAFVEMGSDDEAGKAVEMFHGKEFQGRALTVNIARPREDRPHAAEVVVVVIAETAVIAAHATNPFPKPFVKAGDFYSPAFSFQIADVSIPARRSRVSRARRTAVSRIVSLIPVGAGATFRLCIHSFAQFSVSSSVSRC